MMVCESCGDHEAVIHLTEIKNNQMSMTHLCEKCAAAKGVEAAEGPPKFPLTDFLAQMGDVSEPSPPTEATCEFCGLTFAQFRETGRLGCPHCYASFEDHLRGLLRRIHGGTQHVGKVYLPAWIPRPRSEPSAWRGSGGACSGRSIPRISSEPSEIRDLIRSLEPT